MISVKGTKGGAWGVREGGQLSRLQARDGLLPIYALLVQCARGVRETVDRLHGFLHHILAQPQNQTRPPALQIVGDGSSSPIKQATVLLHTHPLTQGEAGTTPSG